MIAILRSSVTVRSSKNNEAGHLTRPFDFNIDMRFATAVYSDLQKLSQFFLYEG